MRRVLSALLMLAVFGMMSFAVLHGSRSPTGFAVDDEISGNLAPVWAANSTIFEVNSGSRLVLRLNELFVDPEGEELTFIATQSENLAIELLDNVLTITPDSGFVGERVVSIMASDGVSVMTVRIRISVIGAVMPEVPVPEPVLPEEPVPELPEQGLPEQMINETLPEAPLNETVPELNETAPIVGRVVALNEKIRDELGAEVGKKTADEPDYETFFTFIGIEDGRFVVRFYHNASHSLPVWVEGNVSAETSTERADSLVEVNVSVPLRADGSIPFFRLHVGEESEVFEFGIPPQSGIQEGGRIMATCGTCAECTTCAATPGNTCQLTTSISSTGTCITVGADNVVIDCAGNAIYYATGGASNAHGVAAVSRTGITVQNCLIRDTSASGSNGLAINFTNTTYSYVLYNNLIANGSGNTHAVYLYRNASFNTIAYNNITTRSTSTTNYAVYLYLDAHNNLIENNSIDINASSYTNYGVYLNNRVTNNTISNNTIRAIGTSYYNRGIVLSGPARNNLFVNNNITTGPKSQTNNWGICATSSVSGTIIAGNTILTSGTNNNYGIYLTSSVQNGSVENNTITTSTGTTDNKGIYITSTSTNITVYNNIITTNGTTGNEGIYVKSSPKCSIANNIISTTGTSTNRGIYLTSSGNSAIINNSISTNGSTGFNHGIYLYTAVDNTTVLDNNITTTGPDDEGIVIEASQNISLSGNAINVSKGEGLLFYAAEGKYFFTHEITTTNTINNKQVYFYGGKGSSPACPDNQEFDAPDWVHVDFIGCNNITIANYNASEIVTIANSSNLTIRSSNFTNNRHGIRLWFGSSGNLIANSTINATNTTYAYQYGIYVLGAGNNTIQNNIISAIGTSTNNYALFLQTNANDNNITDNIVITYGTSNNPGIVIENSQRNIFSNNKISTGGTSSSNYGIYIYSSSANNIINNNTIRTNGTSGNDGIYAVTYAQNNTIANNTIITGGTSGNSNNGINIESSSSFNNITNNNIQTTGPSSYNRGIHIYSGSHGTFIANNNINTTGTYNNYGVYLYTTIYNTTIANNTIRTSGSSHSNTGILGTTTIRDSIIENNTINTTGSYDNKGIELSSTVTSNTIRNNQVFTNGTYDNYGISIDTTANSNKIINNTIIATGTTTSNYGIYIYSGSYNTVHNNTITTNGNTTNYGIHLSSATLTNASDNNITTNGLDSHGIYLLSSESTVLLNNNITSASNGLFIDGTTIAHFRTNSVANNYINQSPIYYYGGAGSSPPCPNNQIIDNPFAAHIDFIDCNNITLQNFAVFETITLVNVSNTTLTNNNITNRHGIRLLFNSTNNNISFNNIHITKTSLDSNNGILVGYNSIWNTITQNNISTNTTTNSNRGVYVFSAALNNITNNNIRINGTSSGWGIVIEQASGNIVSDNTIFSSGTSFYNYGIFLLNSQTGGIINNNTILTYGSSSNYGIYSATYVQNSTIANNTIRTNGTDGANDGIFLASNCHFNNITGNNIITGPTGQSGNHGIELEGIRNALIANNLINTTGSSSGYGIYLHDASNNNTINNNTISTQGTAGRNYGIRLHYTANLNRIENNTISTYGIDSNYGIYFSSNVHNNTMANNYITTNGSSFQNYGIYITSNVVDNRIINNTVRTGGTTNNYALYLSGAVKTIVADNNFSSNNGYAIYLASATTDGMFNNTIITEGINESQWILSSSDSRNNFTNTTFAMPDGSISILPRIQINGTTIWQNRLNITYNRAFLNSTNLSFFNTSAIIALAGLGLDNPKILVDYEDDGTYVECPASQCTNISYSGGVFVFNTTRFTSYSTSEIDDVILLKADSSECVECSNYLNYTIIINVSSGLANNIVLTETYPDEVIYQSSQPEPEPGTNNTFVIGSITAGNGYVVNISVLVGNYTYRQIVNYVNISYQDSFGTFRNRTASKATIIINRPTLSNATINTTNPLMNNTLQNITINMGEANDTDNQPVQNISDWRLYNSTDFVSIAVLNLPFDSNISSLAAGAIRDYSTYNNNCTLGNGSLANASNWTSQGIVGGAYEFDGVGDLIETPYLNFTNYTVELWIYPKVSDSSYRHIVSNNQNSHNFGALEISSNKFYYITSGSTRISGSGYAGANTWTHVAIVYDGVARLYVNGTLAATSSAFTARMNNTLRIGNSVVGSDSTFRGLIDEVKVYNRAITQQQLYQNYLDGLAGRHSTTLAGNETRSGDVWVAAITPNDGSVCGDGTTITSNNITINGVTIIKKENRDPVLTTEELNYTINITVLDKNASNITLTDNYPEQLIYLSSQPSPVTGTNNTWIIGNLTPGRTFSVNISTLVQNVILPLTINNTANMTFTQEGAVGTTSISTTESTVIASGNPPSIDAVILNTTNPFTNDTNQDLTAHVINAVDEGGIAVHNITDWRRNGTSICMVNYVFDTNTQSTAANAIADYTSYRYNATLGSGTGTPTWVSNGTIGGAYDFDGTSDYMTSSVTKPSLPFTMEMWVYPRTSTPVGIFDSAPGVAQVLRNYGSGYVEWHTANPSVPLGLSANQWHHLVFVFRQTTVNVIDYYRNGTFVSTNSGSTKTDFAWTTLRLGDINTGSAGRYNGIIDDFRIYNRSLSPEQIRQLYEEGLKGRTPLTIIHNETSVGENWSVCVTPNNIIKDGSTVCSNNVTINEVILNISNVSVVKTDYPDPVNVSTNLTYQINVSSTGNINASNVTVNDTYPEQTIYFDSQPEPMTGTNNTWILGNLTPGTNISINITLLVQNISNGTVINNTVNVSFQDDKGNWLNYSAFQNTTVLTPLKVMNITSCNAEIYMNAFLGEELHCNGTAINIIASNLELNCTNKMLAGNGSGSTGIKIPAGLINITILNCHITNFSTGISADPEGLVIENSTFENSTIGLEVFNTTHSRIKNNTFINNTIALLINISENNNFTNNTFINNTISLFIIDSLNNTFNQTLSPAPVIIENSSATGTRINYSEQINMTEDTNLANIIRLENNLTFVNTTAAPSFNISAELTFRGIPFIDPKPMVDYEDDGTYEDCPPEQCTELSYSEGVYVFNVTQFTTYSSSQVMITGCPATINKSIRLTQDIASTDTCIIIGNDSVVLDCDGYRISYGSAGNNDSIGVNIASRNNVTIRNCNITKSGDAGERTYGIGVFNSSNIVIEDSEIRTNGTKENDGIHSGVATAINITVIPPQVTLVDNPSNINYPYCTNQTNQNYCKVCFTTPGVDCAFVGQGGCSDGEGWKSDDMLSFNTTTQPAGGTITVIGGEGVQCYLNNQIILDFYAKNNCGTHVTTNISPSKFIVGQNNLTCQVAGSGGEEDNGFKLSYFAYYQQTGNITTTTISANSTNISIINNIILAAGNGTSRGIFLDAPNSNVSFNRIITIAGNNSYGIFLDGENTSIKSNSIDVRRGTASTALYVIARNTTIVGNVIRNIAGPNSHGIYLLENLATASYNNISITAEYGSIGINTIADNITIIENNVTMRGSASHAIVLEGMNNSVWSNNISVNASGDGIVVQGSSARENVVANNRISAVSFSSSAIYVLSASANWFVNNTIVNASFASARLWNALNNVFNDTYLPAQTASLFVYENFGTIKFTEPINLSNQTNFAQVISISLNYSSVNTVSSAGQQLNKSATLQLFNLGPNHVIPMVDDEGDGTFEQCDSSRCTNMTYAYSSSTAQMNVAHFSTYATKTIPYCGVYDNDEGESTVNITLVIDMNASGTCLEIYAENATINCNGSTIRYDMAAGIGGHGIDVLNTNNVWIENCTIIDVTDRGSRGVGVLLENSDIVMIRNNTIIANGTHNNTGIMLVSADNNTIIQNSINAITTGFENYGIRMTLAETNSIIANNISVIGNRSSSGVRMNSTNYTTIMSNTISSIATVSNIYSYTYGIYGIISLATNITNNTIWTNDPNHNVLILNFGDGHNIENNKISAACNETCYGIEVADNSRILNNTINLTGNMTGFPAHYGISADRYNTIANNTILIRGRNNYGIMSGFNEIDLNNVTGNVINMTAAVGDNYGILGLSNTTLMDNTIDINASSSIDWIYGIDVTIGSKIENNTVLIRGGDLDQAYGIWSSWNWVGNCNIKNNSVVILSTSAYSEGIHVGANCNITNNTVTVAGLDFTFGISGEPNLTVANNLIHVNNSDFYSEGIWVDSDAIIENNTIVLMGNEENAGIETSNSSIANNVVYVNGSDKTVGIIAGADSVARNNSVTITGMTSNYGISDSNPFYEPGGYGVYEIINNSVVINQTLDGVGILASNGWEGPFSRVENNTILISTLTSADSYATGIDLGYAIAKNNIINLTSASEFTSGIRGCQDSIIKFNNIDLNASLNPEETNQYTHGIMCDYGEAGEIQNNNISVRGPIDNTGIYLSYINNISVSGNNILTITDQTRGAGIHILGTAENSTITNNTIQVIGNQTHGIAAILDSFDEYIFPVTNLTISDNKIIVNGTESYGLFIYNATNNSLANNNITSLQSYGLFIINGSLNTFENTSFDNPSKWLFFSNSSTNNLLTNTLFIDDNGSIRILPTITLENETNITKSRLNVSYNKAFLNSTNLSSLNTSAIITLNNILYARPIMQVDWDDDGNYEDCPEEVCQNMSYVDGIYVFNVTHFTSYRISQETEYSNISITKTSNPNPVYVNDNLVYQINVTSTGTANASNVTVNDTYPEQVIYISSQPDPVPGTNNTWILGNLTPETKISINITVLVLAVDSGTVINNTVNVTFQNETSDWFNYYANESTIVLNPPVINYSNITVTKTNTPNPVEPGAQLAYTITVRSTGTGTAHNVTINDTYPDLVIYDSSQPEPVAGTNNTWILGNLTAGTTIIVNITVIVSSSAPDGVVLNNTVNATYNNVTGELLGSNASSSATVAIVVPPPTPSGGGSGGGGGGGVKRELKKKEVATACTENWACTAWSKCFRERQTRSCTDLNACNTTLFMPATERSCVLVPMIEQEKPARPQIPEVVKGAVAMPLKVAISLFSAWLGPLIFALVCIVLLVFVFMGIARTRRREPTMPVRIETPRTEPIIIEPARQPMPAVKPVVPVMPKPVKQVMPKLPPRPKLSSGKLLEDMKDIDARLGSLKKKLKLLDKASRER